MTENFKVVKNKYKKMAIISAIALGAFCGLTVACALLLAFKLSAIEFLWVYYVLIGVGVAAICAVPFYFLLRPLDKKLAEKLDKQYNLNQKVQTMVEFANEQGTMLTLQREQTDEALSVAAKARPDIKGLLKYLFIPVMAVAIACVSIIIPARKTTVYLPQFRLTQSQRTAMNNLIADVNRSSSFSEGLKVASTTALSNLLTELEETTLQSEMKRRVISTVRGIDSIIASTNSYLPLYNSLKGDEYTKPFANSSVRAVAYYKSTVSSAIKTLDEVERQSELSGEVITTMLSDWGETFALTFYHPAETEGATGAIMTTQEMIERVGAYSSAFTVAVQNAEFEGEGDELCTAINNFAADLLTISPDWGSVDYLNQIKAKCGAFISPSCEDALFSQTYNCLMDEFIRNRTAEIFGLKLYEIGSNTNVVPELSDELGEGDGEGSHGPGFGGGDINYASDELVYDPDSDTLVKYGELMARYRARIKDKISEFEALANKEDATAEEKATAKYVQAELSRYITQYLDRLNRTTEE